MTFVAFWWISIIVAVVVTGVVAVLLTLIIRTASAINEGAALVWARGQQVANNTIHIANLYATKDTVDAILGGAVRILGHAEAIRDHARGCPGCPTCILGHQH